MIYMAAPPPKPEPEKPTVEEPRKIVEPELAGAEVFVEEKTPVVARGVAGAEKGALPGDQSRRLFGDIEFVRVPAGKFVMGSKDDNKAAYDPEKPQHTVDITYGYWMGKFILTNRQFAEFIKATSYA